MAKTTTIKQIIYTPAELQVLFDALSQVPDWMDKRFVMIELLGWDVATIDKYHPQKINEDVK